MYNPSNVGHGDDFHTIRCAVTKGKRPGDPRMVVHRDRIAALRAQGCGRKAIAAELDVGVGTVLRAS